ncbi:hypothetical protein BDA96_10G335700 [Sorghum bicolor]|uniref:Uncharacterized protein n=1 Tax=Sorghum bicolor TaxID=4558 RepID=A0A921Q5S6_SORBI|nr:hypothetical protein BDA96_10G335700 [Sorghum bicolor]
MKVYAGLPAGPFGPLRENSGAEARYCPPNPQSPRRARASLAHIASAKLRGSASPPSATTGEKLRRRTCSLLLLVIWARSSVDESTGCLNTSSDAKP